MVVTPRSASPVAAIGFGLAVRDGDRVAGHGALIPVRQMLAWNVLASTLARFRTSKPEVAEGVGRHTRPALIALGMLQEPLLLLTGSHQGGNWCPKTTYRNDCRLVSRGQ